MNLAIKTTTLANVSRDDALPPNRTQAGAAHEHQCQSLRPDPFLIPFIDACREKRNTAKYNAAGQTSAREAEELIDYADELKQNNVPMVRRQTSRTLQPMTIALISQSPTYKTASPPLVSAKLKAKTDPIMEQKSRPSLSCRIQTPGI